METPWLADRSCTCQHTLFRYTLISILLLSCLFFQATGQSTNRNWHYEVTMSQPATHTYHVVFRCPTDGAAAMDVKMPAWTPGYYQLMNYAANVSNVQATDADNKPLPWKKTGNNTWAVQPGKVRELVFTYDVKATRDFVASPYLDEHKGYIAPAGLFAYVAGHLKQPVTVSLHPYDKWPDLIATGLDSLPGQPHTFTAPDYDRLYDSPILMGELEQLPAFTVRGVPHYFIGYKLGNFDRPRFIADLQKIVESGVGVIGDIPYKHYHFLAIGPGGGGIEHLNSTSISFDGSGLDKPEGRTRLYSFLAHEYFHHYNVKRIRPVALGPFDYEHENRTNMLWVSEGLTVYYDLLMLRRAGLITQEELLSRWQNLITSFESKPGRLFQSATQASYETWSDGPFGRTGDDAYKTISYYEKGPILGILLDLSIRQATQNKRSLDDVMRTLYRDYYQAKGRGFTDNEFRQVCEKTAGRPLPDIFAYASTVKPIDYQPYLAYAGLQLTETPAQKPGSWLGLTVRAQNDSVLVTKVDWESPAWKAGFRTGDRVQLLDGQPATIEAVRALGSQKAVGSTVRIAGTQQGKAVDKAIKLEQQTVRQFTLTPLPNPTTQQTAILTDWLRVR